MNFIFRPFMLEIYRLEKKNADILSSPFTFSFALILLFLYL